MRLAMAFAALMLGVGTLSAQMGNLNAPPAKARTYVTYDAEPQVVKAGKLSVIEMRFHVADGYHVNSHTPKAEWLIPTKVTLQPAMAVKVAEAAYPAGTAYSFSFSPKDKLDVYQGDFTVKLPVVAEAGSHEVNGTLRYQACDHAACYPPKNLPIQVIFTAK